MLGSKQPAKIGRLTRSHGSLSEAAAKSADEILSINRYLLEMGYLHEDRPEYFRLTAKAWDRISELNKFLSQSDSAFVAMWFDNCTQKYREAVEYAILQSGYEPIIVDQRHFNDFIMNQIVSSIRQSKFIIADFTCRAEGKDLNNRTIAGVRGGVYWESGYAFALGKPVIQTCEDNEEARDRIHFDLKQYPTIYWKPDELSLSIRTGQLDNPNLVEMLTNRILFLSGRGSYKP